VSDESTHVDSRRMLWLAPLTIAASVVAVLAVREVAIRVVHPSPGFTPLTLGPPIIDTNKRRDRSGSSVLVIARNWCKRQEPQTLPEPSSLGDPRGRCRRKR
jgi:hypothetical protein